MSVPEEIRPGQVAAHPDCHIAECLLPGLTAAAATRLVEHLRQATGRFPDVRVTLLGSLLIPGDEVMLCLFHGGLEDIRRACDEARLPFERIVPCSYLT
jgi:hypothetical protein